MFVDENSPGEIFVWTSMMVEDMVDNVANNENLKEYLIFRNEKFQANSTHDSVYLLRN